MYIFYKQAWQSLQNNHNHSRTCATIRSTRASYLDLMSFRHIVVAGDAPVNLVLYPPWAGPGALASLQRMQTHWLRGGASLIVELLEAVEDLTPQVRIHELVPASSGHDPISSIIELDKHTTSNNSYESSTFKLKCKQQLNIHPYWHNPASLPSGGDRDSLSILILQDAEGSFDDSDSEAAIELVRTSQPRFLLFHMARPLCAGKIWEDVRHGPYVHMSERNPERVIGITIFWLNE